MARPLQYESQFIPTNFSQVGNTLGMYRQDMQQRNQEFDQGVAMQDMTLAQMAEQQTSDPVKQQEMIESLRKRIGEAVNKKGGDYGAAAQDISRLISKERSNPFYGYDKAKLAKLQEEAKAKQQYGINYYSPKNARDIGMEDYLADPSAFDYQATDLAPVMQEMEAWSKNESSLKTEDINEQYDEFIKKVGTRKGYNTPELKAAFLEEKGDQMIQDLMGRVGIEDPQIAERLKQTMLNNIGGDERVNFIADQGAIMKNKAAATQVGMPFYTSEGVSQQLDLGYQDHRDLAAKRNEGDPKADQIYNMYEGQFINSPIGKQFEGVVAEKKQLMKDNSFIKNNPDYAKYIDDKVLTMSFDDSGTRVFKNKEYTLKTLNSLALRHYLDVEHGDEIEEVKKNYKDSGNLDKFLTTITDLVDEDAHPERVIESLNTKGFNLNNKDLNNIENIYKYVKDFNNLAFKKRGETDYYDYQKEFKDFVNEGTIATPTVYHFTDNDSVADATKKIGTTLNLNNFEIAGLDDDETEFLIDKDNKNKTFKLEINGDKKELSNSDLEFVGLVSGRKHLSPAIQVKVKGTNRRLNLYPQHTPGANTSTIFEVLLGGLGNQEIGNEFYRQYVEYKKDLSN